LGFKKANSFPLHPASPNTTDWKTDTMNSFTMAGLRNVINWWRRYDVSQRSFEYLCATTYKPSEW
jgi:hypothetical protein